MSVSARVFIRMDYKKADGSHPIYLRVIINRKKKDYALNLSTHEKYWDERKTAVKAGDPLHIRKNTLLSKFMNKANDIIFQSRIDDKAISHNDFYRLFFENRNYHSFYGFIKSEIEILKEKLKPGTIHNYKCQLSKLMKFRPELNIQEINIEFLQLYENYMISSLKNNQNTISKTFNWLKAVLNRAIEKGIIKENVFSRHNYRIKAIKGKREFLNDNEIQKLEEIYHQNILSDGKSNVLKYFLFCCYTGLRYSDVKTLRYKHIINTKIDNIDHSLIKMDMQKTGDEVTIPLTQKALALIGSGLDNQSVFNVISDQPTNRYLKDIMITAGIKKDISFHCSRHTFAKSGLNSDMNIVVLSKILGHTELKTTMIYLKIDDTDKFREMKKLD